MIPTRRSLRDRRFPGTKVPGYSQSVATATRAREAGVPGSEVPGYSQSVARRRKTAEPP
jgi:hypothetical protein